MKIEPMSIANPGAPQPQPPPAGNPPPAARDAPVELTQPYGSAFDAAYAANVAKIDAMQTEQQKRMMGLSVGLRRASAPGFVMPAAVPVALDVNIRGTPAVGFTVTGHYAYFDPNGDPEGASLFAWLRDGVPIGGATAQSYAIVAADSKHTLAFRVTPVSSVAPTAGAPVSSAPGTIP